MKTDRILIQGLELPTRIGISVEERAEPQRLRLDAEIEPQIPFAQLDEDLTRTVDYYAVCLRLDELAKSKEWILIETLCGESARLILREFAADAVTVTIRKYILPQTEFVAAKVELRRD